MGKRALTKQDYDKCLQAFREQPGNYSHAAKYTGMWTGTCKTLWLEGKPKRNWPAIQDVIAAEHRQARAMLQAQDEEIQERVGKEAQEAGLAKREEALRLELERQRAANDIARSRAEEATMVRGARQNVVGLMGLSAQLIQGGLKLSEELKSKLADPGKMSVSDQTKALQAIASIARQANEAGKIAMHMERTHVGEPTETKEVRVTNMSMNMAKEEILACARELKALEEEGVIDVEDLNNITLDDD